MPNTPINTSVITWKQVGAICTIIGLFITGGGFLHSKADKVELIEAENRCIKMVDKLEKRVGDDVREIKDKQNKIYDILIQMRNTGSTHIHK